MVKVVDFGDGSKLHLVIGECITADGEPTGYVAILCTRRTNALASRVIEVESLRDYGLAARRRCLRLSIPWR